MGGGDRRWPGLRPARVQPAAAVWPPPALQGGPGCSSLFGAFYELGPQLVDEDLGLQANPGAVGALNASSQCCAARPLLVLLTSVAICPCKACIASPSPLHPPFILCRILGQALRPALHRPAARHWLQRGRYRAAVQEHPPSRLPCLLPAACCAAFCALTSAPH